MISRRAQGIDSSGIRRVFDLAAKLKDPVNLSIGQPDFDAFPEIKAEAVKAIESAKNGYTVTQGIPPLRDKIREKYALSESSSMDCMVTSGVSGALFLAYMAMLDPGDEILVPDPFFVMYRDLATLINAVPRCYDTYPDFRLRLEKIEKECTPRTKAIIVASPGNPTGVTLSQSEVDQLVEFARAKNIWLIWDEIYEYFCFDAPHPKILGKFEKTLVLNGFSKSHGVPGWRVGMAVGPKELIQQMLKLQQYTFVCAPSVAQWGLAGGMNVDFTAQLSRYREKRDFIVAALKDKFSFVVPGGAFYLFPEAPGGQGQKFVEKCIENSLLVVPGNVFSRQDTHFRISFSAPMAQLERRAEILNRLAS